MSDAGPIGNGLCDGCAEQKLIRNTRGSVFSLCLRSRVDERFPRYPRVPVLRCAGFRPRPPAEPADGERVPGS